MLIKRLLRFTALLFTVFNFCTPLPFYSGVGVGWQRRCKICQSLRELNNQGAFFLFFLAITMMGIELDHVVRVGEPKLRTREMIASRSVNMVRNPRGSYIVVPIAASGTATPENKVL